MHKGKITKTLQEIAVLLELKGENPFKSRAYENAARAVEFLGEEELRKRVEEDRLKDVKGIGAALSEKLKELVLTGRLEYHEELKASVPAGLFELLKVPGLGPKKIKILYETLGIASLAELEHACRENRLVHLKGFGAKTQQNILQGIEYIRRYQGLFFYCEARQIGETLLERIREFPALEKVSLAGSIRRCKELVKDIDLVASAEQPAELTRFFSELSQVSEIIALGETKASVRLQEGINADLRVVKSEEFPCALHHFTGSKEHNTAMRQRAKAYGYRMNEYGMFRGEERVNCKAEAELYKMLELDYIPPELRENNGEIEAAATGILPKLVEEKDIKGLFHVHTTYSDGSDSLEKVIHRCREEGYEYVGIADHSQSAYYAGGLKAEELVQQQEEIKVLRETYPDIGIFSGVEADIRADGSLDYPDEVLEKLDFVIASIHSGLKMPREKMTERILKALSHPCITMLGHPTGRLLLGREESPLDMEKIFQSALEHGVIIELNATPSRLDLDWRHLKRARELGLLISINPDAHSKEELAYTKLGVAMARKGWLEKKDVFNTRSRREVEAFFKNRRARK